MGRRCGGRLLLEVGHQGRSRWHLHELMKGEVWQAEE